MLQADCAHDLTRLAHHEKIDRRLPTAPIVIRQFRLLQQIQHARSIARTLRLYQERLDVHAAIVAVELNDNLRSDLDRGSAESKKADAGRALRNSQPNRRRSPPTSGSCNGKRPPAGQEERGFSGINSKA